MADKTIVELINFADSLSNREMMKWALRNVRDALDLLKINANRDSDYREMVLAVKSYFSGQLNGSQMGNKALKVHEKAQKEKNETRAFLLTAFGHVLATAQIKEHGLHASEFVIKALKAAGIDNKIIEESAAKQGFDLENLALFII